MLAPQLLRDEQVAARQATADAAVAAGRRLELREVAHGADELLQQWIAVTPAGKALRRIAAATTLAWDRGGNTHARVHSVSLGVSCKLSPGRSRCWPGLCVVAGVFEVFLWCPSRVNNSLTVTL